jgi:hypothetical protein
VTPFSRFHDPLIHLDACHITTASVDASKHNQDMRPIASRDGAADLSLCVGHVGQPWRKNGGLAEAEMKEECAMWDVNQVPTPNPTCP